MRGNQPLFMRISDLRIKTNTFVIDKIKNYNPSQKKKKVTQNLPFVNVRFKQKGLSNKSQI